MPKITKKIKVKNIFIGAESPVIVQSMTNTKTTDVKATLKQIDELAKNGCELIRVSVPDKESVKGLPEIIKKSTIPVVADIHFQSELAIAAINAGAHKIRINPGNIGGLDKVSAIIEAAKEANIPIRIGVNSGSLHKEFQELAHQDLAQALVSSALKYIDFFESQDFDQIVVSVKASSAKDTIKAYRLLSNKTGYPLHLGVTEAGTLLSGSIKSAVALGVLLGEGIGDTIRVSLTDKPVNEVQSAYKILSAVGVRQRGVDIISCPTCARCEVDVVSLSQQAERRLADIAKPLKVAVMGCVVNGPGEAKEADVGIASGKNSGVLFVDGQIIGKYPESELLDILEKEVRKKV
ncbi:MAG: flavodoxin-dependent (E)-4-hydroxy-3-methylbut-2-enyl-diphosphate synthase [Actinobacteria bacterium]|nr:MAG: flavodoxin-dependent (E)-4-hydroxy-3-methylbut-2-enyl-diphosphate synthase [Actinomycetota bacterium]